MIVYLVVLATSLTQNVRPGWNCWFLVVVFLQINYNDCVFVVGERLFKLIFVNVRKISNQFIADVCSSNVTSLLLLFPMHVISKRASLLLCRVRRNKVLLAPCPGKSN